MIYWEDGVFSDFYGIEESLKLLNSKYKVCVFLNVETQLVWADICIGDVWPCYSDPEIVAVYSNRCGDGFITEEVLTKKMSAIIRNYMKGA